MDSFSILTFNTWLLRLPFGVDLAEDIDERFAHLPEKLAATNADVLLLQEVWDPKLREKLKTECAKLGYSYCVGADPTPRLLESPILGPVLTSKGVAALWGLGGMPLGETGVLLAAGGLALSGCTLAALAGDVFRSRMGNGLLILSKHELDPESEVHRFSTFTRPDEYFVVKGGLKTRARIPGLGWIDLFNSHLGAVSYLPKKNGYDPKEKKRQNTQVVELKDWIQRKRTSEVAVIGADLNVHFRERHLKEVKWTPEYSLMTDHRNTEAGFVDSYRHVNGTAEANSFTDCSSNPYKGSGHFKNSPDSTIGYVWMSGRRRVEPVESKVVFKEPLQINKKKSACLSDHFGVLSKFAIRRS